MSYTKTAALLGILALVSCTKEIQSPEPVSRTVISVNLESVKTALGEKEGTAYPNLWKEGDAISLNGIESEALTSEYDGKSFATFVFDGEIAEPYCAAYPASAVSGYDNGTATVTIPSEQKYVAGSYDPEAFLMCGKGDDKSLSISPFVSILHLKVNGSAKISRIRISGSTDAVLSGSFSTNFSSITPETTSNAVEMTCDTPVELPADFFICVPAGLDGDVQIEVFDDADGSVSKTITINTPTEAGLIYLPKTIEYTTSTAELSASLKGVTTSSAAFTWTEGVSAADDIAKSYTIGLFSDAECKEKVISLDIPAGAECWDGKQPCFVFGGLESGKTYFFRATDKETGSVSNVVSATTGEFTNVAFDAVKNPVAGDIILAENFNEWGYGTDETLGAAGFYDNNSGLTRYSGDVDMESVSLQKAGSTSLRLFNQTAVRGTNTRIEWWGFAGNSSVYLRAGYLRVTTTSSGNRTHIVSPKLAAIPDGKMADIAVTARILRTEADNKFGVLLQSGTMKEDYTTGNGYPVSCKLQTGFSESDKYPFDMKTSGKWETHTVSISNVTNANSLAFGSIENIDKKNRFYIAEISVKLTALYDKAAIDVRCCDKSSSTLAFKWTEGGNAAEDIANAYTVSLYKDENCTQLDQSFEIPAGSGCWNGKQPCFIFGGLTPSTSYWLKVADTTNGTESYPVKGTTDAFTVIGLPEKITETGVALAEDFGELRWDYDKCFGAAGYIPGSKSDFSNTAGPTFRSTSSSGEATLKGQKTALGKSRLDGWVTDSNVYIHPGSLKIGTSSARGWILTPEFTVTEGKKAIVSVTVTIARHDSNQENDWAVSVLTPELAKATPADHNASFDWPDTSNPALYQTVNVTNSSVWNTRTVSGMEIRTGDRIVFGGIQGGANSKGRVWISDITVEVTEIIDECAAPAKKLSIIGDSISSFEGCLPSGNKHYSLYNIGGGLGDWAKTYWGALCSNYMKGKIKLEKNISWTGSCVAQDTREGSDYRPAFVTRYGKSNVGATYALNSIGSPDIVIIYGGTNDRYNEQYGLSDVSSTPSDTEFAAIFEKPNQSLSETSFVEAYVKLINMVHEDCPNAKIVNIIGDYVTVQQIASLKKISDHFSFCKYIDFSNGGSGNSNIGKLNGVHPNIDGMDYMARRISEELGSWMLE